MLEEFNLREIQNQIKEIIVDLDKFFKKHDIKYFLMGGSALGAIRHKGFIPWDDDLDIFIPHNDYLKLKKHVSNIGEKYYFEEDMTNSWPLLFSKIKLNNSTYFEISTVKKDIHHGFFIDIMPLINVSDNYIQRKKQYVYSKLLVSKALVENDYQTKNMIKKIILWFSNIWVTKKRKHKYMTYILKFNSKETNRKGHFFGRAKYNRAVYKSKWFETQEYVDFEDVKLPVMNGYDLYLCKRYGSNYMDIPSQSTRNKYPSHLLYANPKIDYKRIDKEKIMKEFLN